MREKVPNKISLEHFRTVRNIKNVLTHFLWTTYFLISQRSLELFHFILQDIIDRSGHAESNNNSQENDS